MGNFTTCNNFTVLKNKTPREAGSRGAFELMLATRQEGEEDTPTEGRVHPPEEGSAEADEQ